ncbi:protein of unknown function DUF2591 [Morganella phage Mecenats66]|nr:protein of unknown function DUF2591 [Morganella phage Mecenats66]
MQDNKYGSLSNLELNKLIAERRSIKFELTHAFHNTGEDTSGHFCDQVVWMILGHPKFGRPYNPAGDWRDAGILAEEEKLSVIYSGEKWCCGDVKLHYDEKPTRAICIAWLNLTDEKENKQ